MNKFEEDFLKGVKSDPIFSELIQDTYGIDIKRGGKWVGFIGSEYENLGIIITHLATASECSVSVLVKEKENITPLVLSFLRDVPGGKYFRFNINEIGETKTIFEGSGEERFICKVFYSIAKNPENLEDVYKDVLKEVLKEMTDDFLTDVYPPSKGFC